MRTLVTMKSHMLLIDWTSHIGCYVPDNYTLFLWLDLTLGRHQLQLKVLTRKKKSWVLMMMSRRILQITVKVGDQAVMVVYRIVT